MMTTLSSYSKQTKKIIQLHNNEILSKFEDLYMEGKYTQAEKELRTTYDDKKLASNLEALLLLGHITLKLNKPTQALNYFKQASVLKCTKERKPFINNSLGLAYYMLKNYQEACFYFGEAVNYETNNVNYRLHLAYCNEKIVRDLEEKLESREDMNNVKETENHLKLFNDRIKEEYIEILRLDPTNYQALLNMGTFEAHDNNYKDALSYFNRAKKLYPSNYKVHLNIGNVYIKDDNFKKAVEAYREALQFVPNNLKILLSQMVALSKLEEWTELESVCKKIIQLDRSNAPALAWLTKALKENKKLGELEKVFLKITSKVEHYEKAQKNDDIKKTIQKLKKKLRERLKNIKNHKRFSREYAIDTQADLNSSFESQSRDGIGQKSNFPNVDKDFVHALGYTEKDAQEFLNKLKVDKNNVEALFSLGVIFFKAENYAASEENFLQILQINPNFKTAVINEKLGDIQFKKYLNFESAKQYYFTALKINANEVLFVKLGRCSEKTRDYENALNEYNKAYTMNPNFTWGIFHIGCVYSKLGKNEDALIWLKRAYDKEKENTDIIAKYTEELVRSNNVDNINKSLEVLEKAKEFYTGNVEILQSLAFAYEKKGNLKDAIKTLEKANEYPEFFSDQYKLFQLALYYEKDHNYSKAIELFKSVLLINKDNLHALLHLGYILKSAKEYKRAFKSFKTALNLDSSNPAANYGIAKIYQAMKSYPEAIHHFSICLEVDHSNHRAFTQLGLIHLETHMYEKAKEMFIEALKINSTSLLGLVGLGNALHELNELTLAETYLKKAYEIDKTKCYITNSYANTLFVQGRYREASKLYEESLVSNEIGEIFYSLAHCYYLLEKYDDAIANYIKAIKVERNANPDYYYHLATTLMVNDRVRDAVKCFRCALKLDPSKSEYYYSLGNAYFMEKMYKQAITTLENCLKNEEVNPSLQSTQLSEVKFLLFKTHFSCPTIENNKCEELIKGLIREDPSNTEYMYHLGLLQEKTNKSEEAKETYRMILKKNPSHVNAKQNLEQLLEEC